MPRVLLLGGSQHLQTFPAGDNFGPISHCGGSEPERYHRTVFSPARKRDGVQAVWYVFATDSYLSEPRLTSEDLEKELEMRGIAPHRFPEVSENTEHERELPVVLSR